MGGEGNLYPDAGFRSYLDRTSLRAERQKNKVRKCSVIMSSLIESYSASSTGASLSQLFTLVCAVKLLPAIPMYVSIHYFLCFFGDCD